MPIFGRVFMCILYEEVDPQETGNFAKILNVKKNDLIDSV